MSFDLIIEQATIADGSGRIPYRADLAIRDGKIAEIGRLRQAEAGRRIDARGMILCPGFVDVHSHADMSVSQPTHEEIFEPLVRQGITTFVGGNCGVGLAPLGGPHDQVNRDLIEAYLGCDADELIAWESFGEFLEVVERQGTVINTGLLAPHGTLRIGAMGLTKRLARDDELRAMQDALRRCLDEGALGMSTGLQYFPGSQSDTQELLSLARVLHDQDAVFTSHLRSYSSDTLDLALDEMKQISREADVHCQISHLFWVPHVNYVVDRLVHYAAVLGSKIYERVKLPIPLDQFMKERLALLGRDISGGLRLGIDGMPTSAGFTHVLAFFPPWALEGSTAEILARLRDPQARRRMRRDIEKGRSVWPHREDDTWSMNFFKLLGWDGVFIMSVVSEKNKPLEGLTLKELGRMQGKHPFDAAADLVLEENGRVLVFETATHPGDDFVERSLFATMGDPNVSIVTDSILLGYGRPSHLFYDCYPKYLARYVRDYGSVSLAEGIRKCTSLPASQLGIAKRGRIEEGHWADIVILDLETVETHSTFERPDVFPDGIDYVLVNGRVVLDPDGYHPDPRPGQVIRRG